MSKFVSAVIALTVILGTASACAQGSPSRIADIASSPTSPPTATPPPTSTPLPTPIPCPKQIAEFMQEAQEIIQQFDDANALAGKTPRVALAQPVGRLQDTRRQVDKIQANDCAKHLKRHLGLYMDSVIMAYLAFMGQARDTEVSTMMDEARYLRDDLVAAIDIVASGDEAATLHTVKYKAESVNMISVDYEVLSKTRAAFVPSPWEGTYLFAGSREPELKVSDQQGYLGVVCELWIDDKLIDRETTTQHGETAICRRNPK